MMKITKKVYQGYSVELDMTTIFEDVMQGEILVSTEVKGFYFGKPDKEGMKDYNGIIKASYV